MALRHKVHHMPTETERRILADGEEESPDEWDEWDDMLDDE